MLNAPIVVTQNSTISANDVKLNTGSITINPGVTLNVPGTLVFGNGLTLSTANSGTMVLSNPNNNMYSLTATVNGGTLQIGDGVNNGSTKLRHLEQFRPRVHPRPRRTEFRPKHQRQRAVTVNGPGALTLSNPITGSNSLTVNNGGYLTLSSGANAYTGPTNAERRNADAHQRFAGQHYRDHQQRRDRAGQCQRRRLPNHRSNGGR